MPKILIAGSRHIINYSVVKKICNHYLQNLTDVTIISGCAFGVDTLAIRYAKEKGYETELYPAQWDKHGKSAGYIRNEIMVKACDYIICIWDGKSKGTKHTIDLAKKYDKEIKVKITKLGEVG